MSYPNISELCLKWAQQNQIPAKRFVETTSTNDIAKKEAFNNFYSLYVADFQTHGRGRGEHHWESPPPGSGLLSSWVFTLEQSPQHITSPLVGLALFEALQEVWPSLAWSIKPPNDLYLNGKKMAGLLVESLAQGDSYRLIIGIGMNIFAKPKGIDDGTCLVSEDGLAEPFKEETWFQVLSLLYSKWQIACRDCTQHQLNSSHIERLLNAINLFPHKKEPFLEVSESGHLISESQTIPWYNL